jgi:hypothetical protein
MSSVFVLRNAETGEVEQRVEFPPKPPKVQVTHRRVPNVILVLKDAATGRVERVVESHNIITNDGAEYYAENGTNSVPTYTFFKGKLALASSYKAAEVATATLGLLTFGSGTSGIRNFDSGYPKTNDSDTDNTGAGVRVATYRRTYTTAEANFTIKALAICRNGATTNPAASATLRKILNYITLSAAQQITKTSSQTLKAFVNHTFSG